jgi:hypothetical protein
VSWLILELSNSQIQVRCVATWWTNSFISINMKKICLYKEALNDLHKLFKVDWIIKLGWLCLFGHMVGQKRARLGGEFECFWILCNAMLKGVTLNFVHHENLLQAVHFRNGFYSHVEAFMVEEKTCFRGNWVTQHSWFLFRSEEVNRRDCQNVVV